MRYEPLKMSFSTGDAEHPRITLDDGCARVAYRNWQEKSVVLLFHDVVAISWDEGEAAQCGEHRNDCGYIVHDSPWLARHREVQTIMSKDEHRHFKLAFNAVGVLQVLASALEVVSESA
jgi:hypothetical protein